MSESKSLIKICIILQFIGEVVSKTKNTELGTGNDEQTVTCHKFVRQKKRKKTWKTVFRESTIRATSQARAQMHDTCKERKNRVKQ